MPNMHLHGKDTGPEAEKWAPQGVRALILLGPSTRPGALALSALVQQGGSVTVPGWGWGVVGVELKNAG